MTLSSVTVTLGTIPGADVRIEVGNSAVISAGNLNAFVTVASKRGIGGTCVFTTNVKAAGRYVLIWFTKLPPREKKTSGLPEYQAAVYNVALRGST